MNESFTIGDRISCTCGFCGSAPVSGVITDIFPDHYAVEAGNVRKEDAVAVIYANDEPCEIPL